MKFGTVPSASSLSSLHGCSHCWFIPLKLQPNVEFRESHGSDPGTVFASLQLVVLSFSTKETLLEALVAESPLPVLLNLAGVLVFSVIPFTKFKAIADSSAGYSLHQRLEERKKQAVENPSRFNSLAQKARNGSMWYGEECPGWLGPISFGCPSNLTGEFLGDYGFDIAGLSKDRVAFENYFNFEILHARWLCLRNQVL